MLYQIQINIVTKTVVSYQTKKVSETIRPWGIMDKCMPFHIIEKDVYPGKPVEISDGIIFELPKEI